MSVFKNVLIFIFSFVLAFFMWRIAELFLPKTPPVFIPEIKITTFYRINLVNKFFVSSQNAPTSIKTSLTLKGVKLKAVYKSDKKAFVILDKNNKTYFVNLGENFQGYKLIKILPNEAIFEKNGKNYKISFEKIKSFKQTPNSGPVIIKRKTFKYYKTHLSEIWKNIGIIKTNEGYKITYIRPGSIFQKIGLKKGDVILEVNNIPLKTDADAWRAYNSIQNYPEVKLLIKRNFNIKVLRYEMD